ncbi:hypothetical protein TrST_g5907 [Triparma strigata]|uniref:Uncharacterized protein n=1 Tax=Triparma strigata TaxID=1606541 RepID=A0A9W6ZWT9_9STRA|nr:hypothetical protein TrST_g5907 [Triparma strigata]
MAPLPSKTNLLLLLLLLLRNASNLVLGHSLFERGSMDFPPPSSSTSSSSSTSIKSVADKSSADQDSILSNGTQGLDADNTVAVSKYFTANSVDSADVEDVDPDCGGDGDYAMTPWLPDMDSMGEEEEYTNTPLPSPFLHPPLTHPVTPSIHENNVAQRRLSTYRVHVYGENTVCYNGYCGYPWFGNGFVEVLKYGSQRQGQKRKSSWGPQVIKVATYDLPVGNHRIERRATAHGSSWIYNSWAAWSVKDDEDMLLAKGDGYGSTMDMFVCNNGQYTYSYTSGVNSGTRCRSCEVGKYIDQIASWDCKICPGGKYAASTGKGSCDNCPKGKHLTDAGTSVSKHDNANDCVICGAGKYQDVTGQDDCKLCPPGKYNAQGTSNVAYHDSLSDCASCAKGTYQDSQGATSCKQCPAGRYGSDVGLTGSSACTPCAKGTYSGSGVQSCTNCGAGKYNPNTGGTSVSACIACQSGKYTSASSSKESCLVCPAGKKQAAAGQSSCQDCGAGTYSDAGATSCLNCPTGRFSADTGANNIDLCADCPAGKWNGNLGRAVCTNCNAGKYSTIVGSSTIDKCQSCPRGAFSSAGSDRCVECAAGKFAGGSSAATSDSACADCSEGKWSGKGATECTACDIGKSTDNKGASSPSECKPCPVGTFMPTGSTACEVCQPGSYNDKENMAVIKCEDCPTGRFNNAPGYPNAGNRNQHDHVNDCVTCPAGKYQDNEGQTVCKLCPSGTYAPSAASGFKSISECTVCPSGKYSETSNNGLSCSDCPTGKSLADNGSNRALHSSSSKCTLCETGMFNNQVGQASCKLCGIGEYQASQGSTACNKCPKGTWNDNSVGASVKESHDELADCKVCEQGKYLAEEGKQDCVDCSAGKYNKDKSSPPKAADHDDPSDCLSCPGGHYSGVASSYCNQCNEGKYSTTGGVSEDNCMQCEKGTFNSNKGQSSCSVCGSGRYSDRYQAIECSACPSGRYLTDDRTSRLLHDASNDCSLCPAGQYGDAEASVVCFSCGIGKSSFAGSSSCTDCAVGTFSDSVGSSSCTSCGDGSYASTTGSSACVPCSPGYYSKEIKTQCLPCSSGKVAVNEGSSTCQDCVAGKYASGMEAANKCNDCDPGKASSSGQAEACPDCPQNHFSAESRARACSPCPSGMNAVPGSSSCSTCAGVITPSKCIECVAGEFASVSSCEPCFAGTYSPGGASNSCTPCQAGKYSSDTSGAECTTLCTECTSCPAGKFSTPGSSSCLSCSAGTYSAVNTPDGCTNCPAGFYSEAEASICSPCESGTYAGEGAPQCSSCSGGKYSGSSASVCVECALGKFSGTQAKSCDACDVGKYADNLGMGSCVNCESGKFASSGGSAACTDCQAGKISTPTLDTCTNCNAGQSTNGEVGQYLCTNCDPGTFSAEGDASCSPCLAGTYSSFPGAAECSECAEGHYCNEGSSNSRENECGSGLAEKLQASKFCPIGTGTPQNVQTGYFTTPTLFEATIRSDEEMCPSGSYCENGVAIPFTQWTRCNQTITIDEAPYTTVANMHTVFKYIADKNSLIENPDLILKDGTPAEYIIIEATNTEVDAALDDEIRASCISADGFTFEGDTLKYSKALNFNDCKAGFEIKVQANVAFDGCQTGSVESGCDNQVTEICTSTVVVKNVNDPPEFIETPSTSEDDACYFPTGTYFYQVLEQSPEFTKVGTFGLEECVVDKDPADSVTFAVSEEDGGTGKDYFGVNPCGGQIFVKEDVDLRYVFHAENNNEYTLNIVVTDTFGATDEQTVTIKLININDPPTFNSNLPTEYTVNENQDIGSPIEPSSLDIASDLDLDQLVFSLLQNEDDAFTIDSGSGRLTSRIMFNYEVKKSYYIKIQVTDNQEDSVPAETDLIKVAVQNLNDSPEFVEEDEIFFEFEEINTVTGDSVGDITSLGTDEDVDDMVSDGTLTYSLHKNDGSDELSEDFEVAQEGAKVYIKVKRDTDSNPFDFEDDSDMEWNLKVKLRDNNEPEPAYAEPSFFIKLSLTNVNEAPVFVSTDLSFEVLETACAEDSYYKTSGELILPAEAKIVVGSIRASEVDTNQEIFLSILDPDVPFVVANKNDEGSGETSWDIIVDKAIDYETGPDSKEYIFNLKVTDGQLSAETAVTVVVKDCNERPTLVSDNKVRTVPENAAGQTVTGDPIELTDLDTSDGKKFSIVGGNGQQFFDIDDSGVLSTIEASDDFTGLDFELETGYYVEIEAEDDPTQTTTSLGGVAKSRKLTYKIDVTNVNEAPVMSDHNFLVTESLKANEQVGMVTVDDPDFRPDPSTTDKVTLQIVTHDYLVAEPTLTNCPSVSNADVCCESTSELFTIVQDVESREYDFKAADYSGKPLNNMGGCNFTMTVFGTDDDGLVSDTVTFKISIRGTNNAPIIEDQTFSGILENPESGTVILAGGELKASDEDTEDLLAWFIVSGGGNDFTMDQWTGAITVNDLGISKMNYEENPSFTLTVGVRDDGNAINDGQQDFDITDQAQRGNSKALYDLAVITLELADAPEKPYFDFSGGVSIFSVGELQEHTTDFALAGLITAKDPDLYDENKLSFSLSSEEGIADNDLPFSMRDVPNTVAKQNQGQIFLKSDFPIDHETKPVYRVSVTVTDSTGLTESYSTEIFVADENEEPEFKHALPHSFTVSEDTGGGVFVGDLSANDPDNDVYQYTIESADSDSLFRLSESGQLFMMAGADLDFETQVQYEISMKAQELGTAEEYFLTSTVVIYVTDVNDLTIEDVSPTILSPGGGQVVTFSGSDMGPKNAELSAETTVKATYVGSDGVVYTAKSCSVVTPNTVIECTTVPGLGVDHEWTISVKAPNTIEWSTTAADKTSFLPPEILGIEGDEEIPTTGGTTITISGSNFGVNYRLCEKRCPDGESKGCGDTCVSLDAVCEDPDGVACSEFPDYYVSDSAEVTYGPSEEEVGMYVCSQAKVLEHGSKITCESAVGNGKDFHWQVFVGSKNPKQKLVKANAQSSGVFRSAKGSYIPPLITSVESETDLKNNREDDSTPMIVTGTNFGVEGAKVMLTYGDQDVMKYSAASCEVTKPHIELTCGSSPGIGMDLKFYMTIAELPSNTYQSDLKFNAPVIKPLSAGIKNAVSGQGATAANTRGGEEINIFGENFGLAGDPFLPTMTYGPTGTEYLATDCVVRNSFSKIRCVGAPGTGFGHKVQMRVGGQFTALYNGNVSYKPPSVYFFDPAWAKDTPVRIGGYTSGKEKVVIHGDNFGLSSSMKLDLVTYGPKGSEYVPCSVADASCNCTVVEDHTKILCFTTEGTGKGHNWIVKIDGQTSIVSTTQYNPPEIYSIEGMVDASPNGGESIVVKGLDFGHTQDKLEYVTYGPSGTEYSASGCILSSHTEIRCTTSEGVGRNLRWLVSVDGQASVLSDATTNYAAPEIISITSSIGETKGMSSHQILGKNLATAVAGTYVELRMDGEVFPLDDTGITKGFSGAGLTTLKNDTHEVINFLLPEMAELDQTKEISVKLGAEGKTNVEQTSNSLEFKYMPPRIDTIENIEGDPAGPTGTEMTTDLVIRGANFGRNTYASIYVNEVVQETWTWDHEKVTLNYLGMKGSVRVKVGDLWSNRLNFSDSSPELLMEDQYLPHPDGYKTTGAGYTLNHRNLTLAGCFFQSSVSNLEITVDGVDCPIFPLSLKVIPQRDGFCENDILREVTCKVPEGTGEDNTVILLRSGNPNYSDDGIVNLKYLAPEVYSFTPHIVDTAGGEVVIAGDNFGNDPSLVEVMMGNVKLEVLSKDFSHSNMVVTVPSGEGRPQDVVITVDGQSYVVPKEQEDKVLQYYAPMIDTIEPNTIHTTGATVAVSGSYFGREGKAVGYMKGPDGSRQDIDVEITFGEHTSLSVVIGPGQGVTDFVLNVSHVEDEQSLKFFPPSLNPVEGGLLFGTEGGEEIIIKGNDFGVGKDFQVTIEDLNFDPEDQSSVNLNEGLFPANFDENSENIKGFNHTFIKMSAPEGQNRRDKPLTMSLVVAGQKSNGISVDYRPPSVEKLVMCKADALSSVHSYDCEGEMNSLGSDCDKYAKGGCGLTTEGGYTLALIGMDFGDPESGAQKVFFGDMELVDEKDILFINHRKIHIRVPPGVGLDIPIKLMVGERHANEVLFSYDPPFIEDVSPDRPDANGDFITIHGVNFAPTLELAGDIKIFVGQTVFYREGEEEDDDEEEDEDSEGGEDASGSGRRRAEDGDGDSDSLVRALNRTEWIACTAPTFGDVAFPIWQQRGSGNPYLWCQTPRLRVGPKHMKVSVAGQNVTVDRSEELITPYCLEGTYGQEGNSAYQGVDRTLPGNNDMTKAISGIGKCKAPCMKESRRCKKSWDDFTRTILDETCEDVHFCGNYDEISPEGGANTVNCTILTREDEYCDACPGGASCELNTQYAEEPSAMEGYWRYEWPASPETCGDSWDIRKHRQMCYNVVPCAPFEACAGDNVCGHGYTGEKCDFCCDAMHSYIIDPETGKEVPNRECWDSDGERIKYFRQYGECAPCPSNPWMIVAILLGGATFAGSIGYVMKKKRINMGICSIGIDYLQILALLSSTKTPWPQIVLDIYTWLSAFNFNINITAPECVFEIAYDDKWKMIMMIPVGLWAIVLVYNKLVWFYKKFIAHKNKKKRHSHKDKTIGVCIAIMYYIYLNLSMTALEVFNCSTQELEDPLTGEIVSDGKQYMQETNWECYVSDSKQMELVPYACVALAIYTVGYPIFVATILLDRKNAAMAREDQVLRAQDLGHTKATNPNCWEFRTRYYKLYYYYKPSHWYWMLVILGRKFSVALIALLFRSNATFQMCMIVLTIFVSSNIQVRAQPYMSMSERDGVIKEFRETANIVNQLIDEKKGLGATRKMNSKVKSFDVYAEMEGFDGQDVLGYFWNYNTVEMILLGCSILVNIFGLMFESQYLEPKSFEYETLANLTVIVICLSLFYLMMVIWTELVVAVFPNLHCRFVERFQEHDEDEEHGDDDDFLDGENGDGGERDRTRSRSKTRSGKKKGLSEDQINIEMAQMEFANNPLYGNSSMANEAGLTQDQLDDLLKKHPDYQKAMNLTKDQADQIRNLKGKLTAQNIHGKEAFDNSSVKTKKEFGRVSVAPHMVKQLDFRPQAKAGDGSVTTLDFRPTNPNSTTVSKAQPRTSVLGGGEEAENPMLLTASRASAIVGADSDDEMGPNSFSRANPMASHPSPVGAPAKKKKWKKTHSSEYGQDYYVNQETKETTWELPPDFDGE